MKFKLSIFLLITILLITGGYFVWTNFGQGIVNRFTSPTPTPDPYAGWKTYTNEEYGFQFKLPSEWSNESTVIPDYGKKFMRVFRSNSSPDLFIDVIVREDVDISVKYSRPDIDLNTLKNDLDSLEPYDKTKLSANTRFLATYTTVINKLEVNSCSAFIVNFQSIENVSTQIYNYTELIAFCSTYTYELTLWTNPNTSNYSSLSPIFNSLQFNN